jgi:hypothetical protein
VKAVTVLMEMVAARLSAFLSPRAEFEASVNTLGGQAAKHLTIDR